MLVLNPKVKETNKKQPTDITIFMGMIKNFLQSYMWFFRFPMDVASLSISSGIFCFA